MQEPTLIDEVLSKKNCFGNTQTEINGKWYIAKPLPYYGWMTTQRRIYHAWLVLRGKALAIQYAEDSKDI